MLIELEVFERIIILSILALLQDNVIYKKIIGEAQEIIGFPLEEIELYQFPLEENDKTQVRWRTHDDNDKEIKQTGLFKINEIILNIIFDYLEKLNQEDKLTLAYLSFYEKIKTAINNKEKKYDDYIK